MTRADERLRKAVFFDRDGVLVREIVRGGRPYAPRTLDEFHILPEAGRCLAYLRERDFLLIVVTNQPDVARGAMSATVLDAMHARLASELPLDEIVVCRCLEADEGCACYKPRPGMLLEAADRWKVSLEDSYMVGDRWRDIGAGRAAGCRTIFLDHGYSTDPRPDRPDHVVTSLTEACALIVGGP